MEAKGSAIGGSPKPTPPTPVTDPNSAASSEKGGAASSGGGTVVVDVDDTLIIQRKTDPPPKRKTDMEPFTNDKSRRASDRSKVRPVGTIPSNDKLIDPATLDIAELKKILGDSTKDTTYDPTIQPALTKSRDTEIDAIWTFFPTKLKKNDPFVKQMPKIDRAHPEYYGKDPTSQAIAKEEADLIMRILIGYSNAHKSEFDIVYKYGPDGGPIVSGYKIGTKSITAIVHRFHFLGEVISQFEAAAAKDIVIPTTTAYIFQSLEMLLTKPGMDTDYEPPIQPATMVSRDDNFKKIWGSIELKKTIDMTSAAPNIIDTGNPAYYNRDPGSQKIAEEEIELIKSVLLAYATAHTTGFDLVSVPVVGDAIKTVTLAYKIKGIEITVLVDRIRFLLEVISSMEKKEEAAKEAEAAEAAKKLEDERLAGEAKRKQEKIDEGNRKAELENKARAANLEEVAKRRDAREKALAEIEAEKQKTAVFAELVRKDNVAKLLAKQVADAEEERLQRETDVRVRAEEQQKKKEDERLEEETRREIAARAIANTIAENEKKRMREEEAKRLFDEDARKTVAAEKEESDRVEVARQAEESAKNVASLREKAAKAEEEKIAAEEKAAEEARNLLLAQKATKEANDLVTKSAEKGDGIARERLADDNREILRLVNALKLAKNTKKVVDLAINFIDNPLESETFDTRIERLMSDIEEDGTDKFSVALLGRMKLFRYRVSAFSSLVENYRAGAAMSRGPLLSKEDIHKFKVGVIREIIILLTVGDIRFDESDKDAEHSIVAAISSVSKMVDTAYRNKKPDAIDDVTIATYLEKLAKSANDYVTYWNGVLAAKNIAATPGRLALKERQDERAIGSEQARLAMMDRRYLMPLHPKDRPNYVLAMVVLIGRPVNETVSRVLTAYATQANKVIGMFDRGQSRERNYGYAIHLGRQAPVRVVTYTMPHGPIQANTYALAVVIPRERFGVLFDSGSGILRIPDNADESIFRHGEVRVPKGGIDGKAETDPGVHEIVVKLNGKSTLDGMLPIKSILLHRWSILLPVDEKIHLFDRTAYAHVKGLDFGIKQVNVNDNEKKDTVRYGPIEPSEESASDDESSDDSYHDSVAADSEFPPRPLAPAPTVSRVSRPPPPAPSPAPPGATSVPRAAPIPLFPEVPKTSAISPVPKNTTPLVPAPAVSPVSPSLPPPAAPGAADAAGAVPGGAPPVVPETPDISSGPKKTSAPSTDILSYDINGWGTW